MRRLMKILIERHEVSVSVAGHDRILIRACDLK